MTNEEWRDDVLKRMRKVAEQTYWLFFAARMGETCHAFIEMNGVISKFVDICDKANKAGIDFTAANAHLGVAMPVEEHDMAYLGEKLGCMFGPSLRANPRAKRAFLRAMFGDESM